MFHLSWDFCFDFLSGSDRWTWSERYGELERLYDALMVFFPVYSAGILIKESRAEMDTVHNVECFDHVKREFNCLT